MWGSEYQCLLLFWCFRVFLHENPKQSQGAILGTRNKILECALKGHFIPAQGVALGTRKQTSHRPEGEPIPAHDVTVGLVWYEFSASLRPAPSISINLTPRSRTALSTGSVRNVFMRAGCADAPTLTRARKF